MDKKSTWRIRDRFAMAFAIAMVVVALLTIFPGWPFIVCLLSAESAPAWGQTIGAVIAIAAGAIGVWWQVGENARHVTRAAETEEIRVLEILGAAIFRCRVQAAWVRRSVDSGFGADQEISRLREMLTELAKTPLLSIPDWRVYDAIQEATANVHQYWPELSAGSLMSRGVHDRRRGYMSFVINSIENAEGAAAASLSDRGAQLIPMSFTLRDNDFPEGEIIKTLDYDLWVSARDSREG
ncbi:hypothetical protein [Xylophilus sp. Leaf220]|uniref:hypothetical protein n=1 Tax=Xylophilus sp. Leaf220 TaxID=1735686 RepID=UPI0012E20132|nr:hypothetical protein [Xylophilus sp. Leaf220]